MRPSEGHAEMSACVNLPDGRSGFYFTRAPVDGNRLAAGGQPAEIDLRVATMGLDAVFTNEWMHKLYVPDEPEPSEEQFLARARAGTPMGIPCVQPSDVPEAVVWLASPAARYVTGVLLPVDGGSAIP